MPLVEIESETEGDYPATGTICTPRILTRLADDARRRSGLRHVRMTTAIELNRLCRSQPANMNGYGQILNCGVRL